MGKSHIIGPTSSPYAPPPDPGRNRPITVDLRRKIAVRTLHREGAAKMKIKSVQKYSWAILGDGLAGVELGGHRGRALRVGLQVGQAQAQRVLGGLVDAVEQQRHAVLVAHPSQAHIPERALRCAGC